MGSNKEIYNVLNVTVLYHITVLLLPVQQWL